MKRKLVRAGSSLVRAGTAHYEDGKVTPRFRRTVASLLKRRAGVYRALAK